MLRNLALLAASSAVALLVAETGCRILVPQLGWRLFPDVGLGWSSREYQSFDPADPPREPGRPRLLFLGDSHLAGAGNSSLDARFPMVLQKRLNGSVDVAVLASGSWGTDQELLAFLQKGRAWHPDLVFLAFCPNNDLANILSNTHAQKTKPYFVLRDGELAFYTTRGKPVDLGAFRAESDPILQSYLLDLLRFTLGAHDLDAEEDARGTFQVDPRYLRFDAKNEKLWEIAPGQRRLSWSPQYGVNRISAWIAEDFEINRYQWSLFARLLDELNRAVRASDAELVVMMLPVGLRPRDLRFVAGSSFERRFLTPDGAFTFRAEEPRDRVRAIADDLGIRFFDPSAEFLSGLVERGIATEAWPHLGDLHLSDVGDALLAEVLEAWLAPLLEELGAQPAAQQGPLDRSAREPMHPAMPSHG